MARCRQRACKSSDGRWYEPETMPLPPDKRQFSESQIRHLHNKDKMSASEIFLIERFLSGQPTHENIQTIIETKERKRIAEEYNLQLIDHNRYMGDPEYVWSVLQKKFPEASAKYKSYTACQYALKYGAVEPCEWKKPTQANA